jgi:hypothetical protein
MVTANTTTSKTAFLRAQFASNPALRLSEAKAAWQEAGNPDELSSSLFYIIKRQTVTALPGRRGRPARQAPPGGNGNGSSTGNGHSHGPDRPGPRLRRTGTSPSRAVLDQVEDGIDDLIVLLKLNGGLPAVEAALRSARRLIGPTRSN